MFKELMKEKSIKQQVLADKLNVSQVLISKWVNGMCQPQIDMLPSIAKVLGVSIEEVVKCFQK
ncbi:MAG: helix-turn-helix transcriptional regulator [Bacillota bacterium]